MPLFRLTTYGNNDAEAVGGYADYLCGLQACAARFCKHTSAYLSICNELVCGEFEAGR